MFYIIYQLTNTINGKIYIGKHQTVELDDNYMGSGKLLKAAIKKYGLSAFNKEILHIFESEMEMNAKEAEIVNNEFCNRLDTYNLCPGGQGGWGYVNILYPELRTKGHNIDSFNKISIALKGRQRPDISQNLKNAYAENRRVATGAFSTDMAKEMSARAQLPHVAEKRANTRKSKQFQQGLNNSQYGTTWVWHELLGNKKIKKELLSEYIEQGWVKTYKPGYKIP